MLRQKEFELLSHFRKNARSTLTNVSRKTGIPVSSIFDRLRRFKDHEIAKHTSLLNFNNIGFGVIVKSFIKAKRDSKKEIMKFLLMCPNVNNISALSNKYDVLIEAVFRNLKELRKFNDAIYELGAENKEDFYVIEYLKRESFLCNPEIITIAE